MKTYLGEDGLESLGIVGLAVSLRALRADANEVADSIVDVLRVCLLEDASGAVEENRALLDRGNVVLLEHRGAVRALEDVALGPRVDCGGAAGEHGRAVRDADGDRDVGELDVVQDERAVEAGARSAVADEDRGVGDDGVDDSLSADTLSAALLGAGLTLGDVNTNLQRRLDK